MTQSDAQPKTAEELGAALTAKQRRLAEAYLETMSIVQASKTAKYNCPANGSRALKHPKVQAYIQARMATACMPANEVLARLSAYARVTGDQFTREEEYEVPVYEARPLREQIDYAEAKVARMNALDPGVLKAAIEGEQKKIAAWEVELAMDPGATYQKQVGTRTLTRIVPSLEAAAENGVLFALESVEDTLHGKKWKRVSSVEALTLIGKHHKLFTEKVEHSGKVEVLGIDYLLGGDS